jgi:hypothetical protein
MHKSASSLLVLIFYFLLGFLVLHAALGIGFLGDFAGDIYQSQSNWLNFPAYHWNFYLPVMVLYYYLYKIFYLSPLPYQALHLALIFINAWLLYLLAQELKFETWQCLAAGLLALFNSVAFETYFWLSTIPKVLATSFVLVALISLIRFRQNRLSIWGWAYIIMVTIGITVESTALILPFLGLLLDIYYQPWRASGKDKSIIFSGMRLHLWTFGAAGIFLLIRYLLGIRTYVINLPVISKFQTLLRTISSTFFHGLPEHFWFSITGIPLPSEILFLLLIVVVVLALQNKHGSYRRRFVTLLLLWMAACLPHVIAANFQSRYLYFPGVFSALVLVDLLGSFRLSVFGRSCTWLVISLIITGYVSVDIYSFQNSLSYYLDATKIYNAGISKIETYLPHMPSGTRLVLIDFPDSIFRPRNFYHSHAKKYRILVYRNGLPSNLQLLYPNANFTVIFRKLSPPSYDNPDPLGSPSSPEQLRKLLASPRTVACRYLPGDPGKFLIYHRPKTILIN